MAIRIFESKAEDLVNDPVFKDAVAQLKRKNKRAKAFVEDGIPILIGCMDDDSDFSVDGWKWGNARSELWSEKYYYKIENGYKYAFKPIDKGGWCYKLVKSKATNLYPKGYDKVSDSGFAIYYTQLKDIYNKIMSALDIDKDEMLSSDGDYVGIPDGIEDVEYNADDLTKDGGIYAPDKGLVISFEASACSKDNSEESDIPPYPRVVIHGKIKKDALAVVKDAIAGTAFKIGRED